MRDDRLDKLEEAQEKIREAIELIRAVVAGTGIEKNCESYVIASLRMCMTENSGYLGNQPYNIDELMEYIQDGYDEDIEDDADQDYSD